MKKQKEMCPTLTKQSRASPRPLIGGAFFCLECYGREYGKVKRPSWMTESAAGGEMWKDSTR